MDNTSMSILGMLKRRNLEVVSSNGADRLIFPKFFPKKSREKLNALLHSYGFRTVLKDAILRKENFAVSDLIHYCSEETARLYLKELVALKLVKRRKDGSHQIVRSREADSLSDTLEWFLAVLLKDELECDSLWNVSLAGLPSGGDFDVLADCENHLLYVEVKSSPPKSIEGANIASFLNRVDDLRPDLSIFFEDTTLSIREKILPLFEEELARRFKDKSHLEPRFEAVHDETYRFGSLFITNSKTGILETLRICLAAFLKDRGIHLTHGII